jgi:hypothetical protein
VWREGIDNRSVPEVTCAIVRWLSDEPQPGWVEANLTDANGRVWQLFDKWVIFSSEVLSGADTFPRSGSIACEVLGTEVMPDGTVVVAISTEHPDHVESVDGESRFLVRADQVRAE